MSLSRLNAEIRDALLELEGDLFEDDDDTEIGRLGGAVLDDTGGAILDDQGRAIMGDQLG